MVLVTSATVMSRSDEGGMVLVSARPAPEDAAVVLAAVEAARKAAWRAARPGDEGAENGRSRAQKRS
jgi:hypothetical protein